MAPPFAHLSVRSVFSLREGAIRLDELASRTRALGMETVALTDRDSMAGAVRFTQACARYGVRPIYGVRLTTGTPSGAPGSAPPAPPAAGSAPPPPRALRDGSRRAAATRPSAPVLPVASLRAAPGAHRASGVGGAAPPAGSMGAGAPGRWVTTLVARGQVGYENLCRVVTAAHHAGERGDPCATPEDVARFSDEVICVLGPDSDVGRLAAARAMDDARAALARWLDVFGFERTVLGIRDWLEPGERATAGRMLSLADECGVRAAAVNDARALIPADAFLCDVLDAMRKLVPLAAHHRDNRNHEATLKSPAEMAALFDERPDLLVEAYRVAQECTAELRLGQIQVPSYPMPDGLPQHTLNELLASRCFEGLARRGMRYEGKTKRLLDAELAMAVRLGFAGYFLTVADIVRDIKAKGIRAACRGSAAGSLICYLTGISEVDPVEHDLVFERFMNEYRTTELPDIDLDVESARREEIYRDILSTFEDERVGCVAMVDTYRARGAIREVGKALALPEAELDLIAKSFPHISASGISEALEHLPELKRSSLKRGHMEMLFRVAERLDGFPRHLALHPSGILIAPNDLLTRMPFERSANGFRMSQFDKDDVEALGLLKLDVIGIRMLSSMSHATAEIRRTAGAEVDLDAIPRDDEATFELIRSSRTLGCFQIESPGQRELLGKLQPDRWKDLIVDISLFRPGPVRSDMVSPYLMRRGGWARAVYAHPELRTFLGETHGVIVYHEQVMRAIAAVTGITLGRADQVRRALEDESKLPAIKAWFVRCGRANQWRDADIEAVWREVASFAAFGFCKAHAAAFAVPTYQSCWLKANHPAAFYAGVLTHEPGMYPRRAILDDARQHGLPILPLDINASDGPYTVEAVSSPHPNGAASPTPEARWAPGAAPSDATGGTGAQGRDAAERRDPSRSDLGGGDAEPEGAGHAYGVRIGLEDVAGISGEEIEAILAARAERRFEGLVDFCRRARVDRPTAESLIHAGAFDAFGERRDLLLRVGDLWEKRRPKPEAAPELLLHEPVTAWGLRPYSDAEKVRAELEVTGMDVSRHIITFYGEVLNALGATPARDLRGKRQDARVMIAGVKVASQTPAVRSGQRIIFVTLDDGTALADATVFESVQEQCAFTIFHSWLLLIRGTVRKTGSGKGGVSINCERAWDLAEVARDHRAGTLDIEAMWIEGVAEIERAERERRTAGRRRPAPDQPALPARLVPIGARTPKERPRPGEPEHGPDPATPEPLRPAKPITPVRRGRERVDRPAASAPRKLWHASGGSAGA